MTLAAVFVSGESVGDIILNPQQAPAASIVGLQARWSADAARAGDRIRLAVVLDVADGYHINADSAQIHTTDDFRPIPTRVAPADVDAGLVVGAPRFPRATAAEVAFLTEPLMAFDGRTVVVLPVTVSADAAPGTYRLVLTVRFQACDDQTCLFPRTETLETAIRVAGGGEAVSSTHPQLFADTEPQTPPENADRVGFDLFGWRFSLNTASVPGQILLLAIAAIGGALLNFTPCVLPLVPIKIIGLSMAAEQGRHRCAMLGLFMFLGVLGFWVLLGVMIAAISGFTATNQLFQYPPFTIGVGTVIALMALGMMGAFHTRLPGFVYAFQPDQESLPGAFAMGILTAVLSTPCTAPFMGAAAAWAATRPPATTLSTFAAIGIGMALPYLLLSIWPQTVRKIPKSGPGSVLVKQVMGLLMMAAAAYFIGSGLSAVFARPPDPPSRIYWWAVAAGVGAAGVWLACRTIKISRSRTTRSVFVVTGLFLAGVAVLAGLRLTDTGPVDWVYYTPERFDRAVAGRQTVVMVFTAEWCLNCKALEQGVFHNRRLAERLARKDVVPIKVDITGSNPAGKAKLRAMGRLTIPLLVVFSPDGKPVFTSDFYTADQVLRAIDDGAKPSPLGG